jgi:hypothetical protein
MDDKTLFCLKTITYTGHSHSIVSGIRNRLKMFGFFQCHLNFTVRLTVKIFCLVPIEPDRCRKRSPTELAFKVKPSISSVVASRVQWLNGLQQITKRNRLNLFRRPNIASPAYAK